MPGRLAVMTGVPAETPVRRPPGLLMASAPVLVLQPAVAVRSCVVPSERMPVACICSVVPAARVVLAGATTMEVSTAVLPLMAAEPGGAVLVA